MSTIKRALILTALSLFTAVTVATATAAHAATITGTGTSVTFTGTGDDFITGDQPWSYDPSNSVISASVSPDGNSVSVSINGDTFWNLNFAAPQGQALTTGTVYDNAARYPFQGPLQPGLSLFGDGRACNTSTGSFTVKNATFGPHGWIQDFDATFVQHCEGDPNSAATGEVILSNGPAPPELTVTVTPAATDPVSHASGQVTLTGTITCNRATTVNLTGTLTQRVNRTTLATANWFIGNVPCNQTAMPWTVTAIPTGTPFGPGNAELDTTTTAFDPVFGVNDTNTSTQTVKLSPH